MWRAQETEPGVLLTSTQAKFLAFLQIYLHAKALIAATMIADAGFLVALLLKNDRYHSWAKHIGRLFDPPFLTCEEVITEACFKVGGTKDILNMLADGRLKIPFQLEEHLRDLLQLGARYADRRPDLADLCVIKMSELNPQLSVITVDRDFLIYRRDRNQPIPVIMPLLD
jgi:uncharacterized protein